jgi:flavodoxin
MYHSVSEGSRLNSLVVYDSVSGNTEKIAAAVANTLGAFGEVKMLRAGDASPGGIKSVDLLVIGSPTRGGRPLPAVKAFTDSLAPDTLKAVKFAVFDTRLTSGWVRIFGYAADRLEAALIADGATPAAPPAGFFVKGNTGPLKEGEEERAESWARQAAAGMSSKPTG